MAATYPPFVNAYKKIPDLFKEMEKAAIPSKFTLDFLNTKLGLKSTSFRAMIPLLKRLNLIDNGNIPTDSYKKIKDPEKFKHVLADLIKTSYADLYTASEFAHNLNKQELITKLLSLTGAAKDDSNIPNVAGTFIELCKMANFDKLDESSDEDNEDEVKNNSPEINNNANRSQKKITHNDSRLGISYTINLNMPATTDIEVFNSIFKSLKEHILGE